MAVKLGATSVSSIESSNAWWRERLAHIPPAGAHHRRLQLPCETRDLLLLRCDRAALAQAATASATRANANAAGFRLNRQRGAAHAVGGAQSATGRRTAERRATE